METPHAPDVLALVQAISVEHLLYGFDALGQETAHLGVLALALVAVVAWGLGALVDHVAVLVALVTHRPLRATL